MMRGSISHQRGFQPMTMHVAHLGQPHHPHVYRCYAGVVVRLGRREFIFQAK